MNTLGRNDVILCVSDLHAPYGHPDTVPFLTAVHEKYQPTRVILSGDEADKQALKFHPTDPDLPSSGDELDLAIARLQPLYDLWPRADVMESNHGSLAYRKATVNGISRKYLKSYREVLQAPEGWLWHSELTLQVGDRKIFFHHGISADVLSIVNRRGVCVVQGHYHNSFEIRYSGNPDGATLWGMTVGCTIDPKSLAFAYNTNNLGRPVIGCGIIIDGLPKLLPMLMDERGRWNGYVP